MADVSILGADAVRGDPGGLDGVARFLRTTAEDLDRVRATLNAHTFSDVWEGAAADAFRELLHDTPGDVDRAARSYDLAAETVTRYAGTLQSSRATAESLAAQLADARSQLDRAGGGMRSAQQAVDAGRRAVAHATDPAAHAQASHQLDTLLRTLAGVQGQQGAAQSRVDAILRQAHDNRRALEQVGQAAADRLLEASNMVPHNSLASKLHKLGHVLGQVGHVAWKGLTIAAHTLVEATDLLPALIKYFQDPSWDNLDRVLDDLASALTVVTFALMIAATVLTGGAFLAAIPELLIGLRAGIMAVEVTKLTIDTARYGAGDDSISLTDLGVDAFGVFSAGSAFGKEASKSSGWIRGMQKMDSDKWSTWAAKCVVVGDGENMSWATIRATTGDAQVRIVTDFAKDSARDGAIDQVKDIVDEHVPVFGRPEPTARELMRSAAVEVRHKVLVPKLTMPMMPAAQAAAGGAR